jgi:hypothetical protein
MPEPKRTTRVGLLDLPIPGDVNHEQSPEFRF